MGRPWPSVTDAPHCGTIADMRYESFRSDLKRARRGDRGALDRALRQVDARVRAAARNRLNGSGRRHFSTSDILQTTYLDVVRKIHTFRGDDEDTFAAWLTTILENNVRDKARALGRDKRKGPTSSGRVEPDTVAAPGPTPSRAAIQVESLEAVGQALDRLDDTQRRIILMRLVEGKDYREIADALGRSVGAARMLYFRARAALAVGLTGDTDGE